LTDGGHGGFGFVSHFEEDGYGSGEADGGGGCGFSGFFGEGFLFFPFWLVVFTDGDHVEWLVAGGVCAGGGVLLGMGLGEECGGWGWGEEG